MTDIKKETIRYAQDAIDTAKTLSTWDTLRWQDRDNVADHYGIDRDDDWIDLLNVMALEVYGTARVSSAHPPVLTSITVVTGTGGPHVEFEVYGNDTVVGRAIWGSDSTEKHDTMPGLFEMLAPLVGEEA